MCPVFVQISIYNLLLNVAKWIKKNEIKALMKISQFSGISVVIVIALILAFFFSAIRNIVFYFVLFIELLLLIGRLNSYNETTKKLFSVLYLIFTGLMILACLFGVLYRQYSIYIIVSLIIIFILDQIITFIYNKN
jgi:hypothetical protein